jgi:putative two-component system hydrogenase maturation factor HypX/HoxX
MQILFLVSAHNSLSQRAEIELTELGHEVHVAVVESAEEMEDAVAEHEPALIACPMLKSFIPESIWSTHRCLVVHPGPVGDRGPSSLDWAIELEASEWGVTVLEANGEADAGDVWATRTFATRAAGKTSLYRHEVRRAAIEALVDAIGRVDAGESPIPLDYGDPRATGDARPLMKQEVRKIDWRSDSTATVVRRIRAAEGHPGVLDSIGGTEFHLFGAHRERALRGEPGELLAQRNGAICRATVDGAVWITHLKRREADGETFLKLPATRALELAGHAVTVPEVPVPVQVPVPADHTYREIAYEERDGVGYLSFDFYDGAMSTEQCLRLRDAYRYARSRRHTNAIVLMGGADTFSNGIHLKVIEASDDPAAESWRNLNAMNDLVRDVIETDSHVVVSALTGDAAAGGVALALAADRVVAREDVVLNPYYQHMGGLYGSEYWTYLFPRRVGPEMTARLTGPPFGAIGARRAVEIGLLDGTFGATAASFLAGTELLAARLVADARVLLQRKRLRRACSENRKPLEAYRAEEMRRSHWCFFGPDPSYHDARHAFAYKLRTHAAPSAPEPVVEDARTAEPASPHLVPAGRRSLAAAISASVRRGATALSPRPARPLAGGRPC